jgi:hypothetical protein
MAAWEEDTGADYFVPRILFFIFFFWAIIPYYLIKWTYNGIVVPHQQRKKLQVIASPPAKKDKWIPPSSLEPRDPTAPPRRGLMAPAAERVRLQKETLAAVAPVERMTATIETHPTYLTLRLKLSEEERAIILTHRLHEIPLEDEPFYTDEDIRRFQAERVGGLPHGNSQRAFTDRAIAEGMTEDVIAGMRTERRLTTIADYLKETGFMKHFNTPYEVSAYANKLKTEILPKIKNMIDSHRHGTSTSETIEF